jgi:hypothetical protein
MESTTAAGEVPVPRKPTGVSKKGAAHRSNLTAARAKGVSNKAANAVGKVDGPETDEAAVTDGVGGVNKSDKIYIFLYS